MNYFGMYILAKLDCWHNYLMAVSIIGFVILGLGMILIMMFCDLAGGEFAERFEQYTKFYRIKMWFSVMSAALIISALLPTTKQAAFIYIAPQIIENGAVKDTVKNIPELAKLGTDYLKELLKDKINEQ
jgi:hypothetical protein